MAKQRAYVTDARHSEQSHASEQSMRSLRIPTKNNEQTWKGKESILRINHLSVVVNIVQCNLTHYLWIVCMLI